jgi:glycosyltransferase involved in cell wall biosynthesis
VSTERACRIALDATYSLGENLSGVGVYSREILFGLTQAHPNEKFLFYYRPHRFLRSLRDALPPNARRRLLARSPGGDLFHALNQRVDCRARRTVSTFHDLFVMTGEYSTPEFRRRFAAQARAAAERSDMIIAVSRFTASQVEQLLGVEPARIRVVPHGVHLPTASPPTSREKLILCVGAIQRRKNIARVVKAFESLPAGWSLVLAGAQDGYGAAEEVRAVEQSPRRAGILVAGYVPAEKLDSLYRRASILAFPSLDEGFGMPVLEAMAHGVAVVTSNRSALPEVAGGAALLVDPEDPDDIAGALARLAAGDALRQELAIRGLARARKFSWDSAVEKTWVVYRELL